MSIECKQHIIDTRRQNYKRFTSRQQDEHCFCLASFHIQVLENLWRHSSKWWPISNSQLFDQGKRFLTSSITLGGKMQSNLKNGLIWFSIAKTIL